MPTTEQLMRPYVNAAKQDAILRNYRAHAAPAVDPLDRREPSAPVDFHDEHTYDRAFRAEMRDCERAEWNMSFDWRTR